ncbi:MAG: hypothetical protein Q9217_003189 [Psora testacea]
MLHYNNLYLYLLSVAGFTISTVTPTETQDPSFNCLGGPAFGLNAACDFNNFGNLSSHAPSEVLYQVLQQANLPNDTFYPNAVCVYPEDVPQGGLTLGEIRKLSRALIDECSKCGRMSVNWLSKNESQLGWLKFDWQDPPTCLDDCIDPEKDLRPVNATNSNAAATSSSAAERSVGGPILVLDRGMASTVVLCVSSFLFGVAAVVI